ncbi:hypothetical protein BHM03_00010745 [Ensete ventricosum]|nr:hypothetical protein BHM03_00010745 [Ensete ventricosum]
MVAHLLISNDAQLMVLYGGIPWGMSRGKDCPYLYFVHDVFSLVQGTGRLLPYYVKRLSGENPHPKKKVKMVVWKVPKGTTTRERPSRIGAVAMGREPEVFGGRTSWSDRDDPTIRIDACSGHGRAIPGTRHGRLSRRGVERLVASPLVDLDECESFLETNNLHRHLRDSQRQLKEVWGKVHSMEDELLKMSRDIEALRVDLRSTPKKAIFEYKKSPGLKLGVQKIG